MATFVSDLVDQHESLAVGQLQVPHDLTHSCENRTHREGQAVHAAALPPSCLLAVADVVQPGITNRSALFGVVELLAVVGEDGVKTSAGGVGQKVHIPLALPVEIVYVHNIVPRENSLEGGQERLRNIFIQKHPHADA